MTKFLYLLASGYTLFCVVLFAAHAAPIKQFSDAWLLVTLGVANAMLFLFFAKRYWREA